MYFEIKNSSVLLRAYIPYFFKYRKKKLCGQECVDQLKAFTPFKDKRREIRSLGGLLGVKMLVLS